MLRNMEAELDDLKRKMLELEHPHLLAWALLGNSILEHQAGFCDRADYLFA